MQNLVQGLAFSVLPNGDVIVQITMRGIDLPDAVCLMAEILDPAAPEFVGLDEVHCHGGPDGKGN